MKSSIAIIIVFIQIIFSSCRVNKSLPLTKDAGTWPYGSQAIMRYSENNNLKVYNDEYKLSGEIIAVEKDSLYILTHAPSHFLAIGKEQIARMTVAFSLTSDSPNKFGGWTALLCLSTLAHGFFAGITLPLNAIVGANISTAAAQSTFAVFYPDNINWEELKKFARFPQGIPEGTNPATLSVKY